MPKLKTHSGAKDRIKITKNGKVMRRHSNASHFLQKRSSSSKRKLAGLESLSKQFSKNIKLTLGV